MDMSPGNKQFLPANDGFFTFSFEAILGVCGAGNAHHLRRTRCPMKNGRLNRRPFFHAHWVPEIIFSF
jgi:hypothetical protein